MKRTECGRGHDLTKPENLYDYPPPNAGKRQCYVCHWGKPRRPPAPPPTHCGNGHEWSEANTYVNPNGKRACRSCVREWRRLSRARVTAR